MGLIAYICLRTSIVIRSQIPHHGAGKYGIAGYLLVAWLALRFNVFGIPYNRAFDGNAKQALYKDGIHLN